MLKDKAKLNITACISLVCLSLTACGGNSSSESQLDTPPIASPIYRDTSIPIDFHFTQSEPLHQILFSDYPVGEEERYELTSEVIDLPEPFSSEQGLRLYGRNFSDDLFMAAFWKVDKLEPAKIYDVAISSTIITNVPSNCLGIGGAPGEAVYIKHAANNVVPKNEVLDGMHRINWDIGAQAQRGEHSYIVGDLSNGIDCTEQTQYVEKLFSSADSFSVQANDNGEIWILVGSDSGFEGASEYYIKSVNIEFEN